MKKREINDLRFLYLSTRLTAIENSLIKGEKLTRLSDARDYDEAFSYVLEYYGLSKEQSTDLSYEEVLSSELSKAYDLAAELIDATIDTDNKPHEVLYPLRFVYDCQNLKSAIKCSLLDRSAKGMLYDTGTVGADEVESLVRERDFNKFPENLAKQAPVAIEQLSATADPQEVDLLLDRAVFRDMLKAAEDTRSDYITELVKLRIDSVNIISCIRCIKQKKSKAYMQKLYIDGGKLEESFFTENYDENPSKLLGALAFTDFSALAAVDHTSVSSAEIEKLCDNVYAAKAYSASYKPFGIEKAVCYIIQKEYEIKNVRIILAGKSCGLASDKIKERLRVSA